MQWHRLRMLSAPGPGSSVASHVSAAALLTASIVLPAKPQTSCFFSAYTDCGCTGGDTLFLEQKSHDLTLFHHYDGVHYAMIDEWERI